MRREQDHRRYGDYSEADEGRDRLRRDYGYGRGGQPDHDPEFRRRDFRGGDFGGQFRQSSPGGFGQAQGTSAWRGHGVDERVGSFSGGGWIEPTSEGPQYAAGLHRGKGPKGYRRSDERLLEMLCERLRDDPHIDASDVSVTVEAGRVTFEGTVDSRQTKNLIEDVAEQLGVDDVQNFLRVQRPGAGANQNPSSGMGAGAGRNPQTGSDAGEDARRRRN